jgi:cbb3-type cytochrome oxidase subunit 1
MSKSTASTIVSETASAEYNSLDWPAGLTCTVRWSGVGIAL